MIGGKIHEDRCCSTLSIKLQGLGFGTGLVKSAVYGLAGSTCTLGALGLRPPKQSGPAGQGSNIRFESSSVHAW